MRKVQLSVAVFVLSSFVCAFSSRSVAQLQTATSESAVSGNTILVHLLQQSGWTDVPTDAVAVGEVRDPNFPDVAPGLITVRARGWEQIKFETTRNGKSAATVINSQRAMRIDGTGKSSLSSAFALSSRVPVFPFFTIITRPGALRTANWIGSETIGKEVADIVEVSPQLDAGELSSTIRNKTERYKLWISRSSGLLLQISKVRLADSNARAELLLVRKYSDYRTVSGRLFPFHQEQWIDGQITTAVDFKTASFDQGLTDADFAIQGVD